MQKTDLSAGLREAILVLEKRQAAEGKILKDHFLQAYESIKPINLIKNTFKEITESNELKDNIINTSVGLATGFVSKKLFVGRSHNPFKRLLGSVLMFGITNVVSKNTETIKAIGKGLFDVVIKKNDTQPEPVKTTKANGSRDMNEYTD
jgi:hypothetical protein